MKFLHHSCGHPRSVTNRSSSCSNQDGGQAKDRVDDACHEAGDFGSGEGGGRQGPLVETLAGQTSQGLRGTAVPFQEESTQHFQKELTSTFSHINPIMRWSHLFFPLMFEHKCKKSKKKRLLQF